MIKNQQTTVGVVVHQAVLPAYTVKIDQKTGDEQTPEAFGNQLSAHLNQCWSLAKVEKQTMQQERLLRCERQRRGQYDGDKLTEIRTAGGSEIYMMLTNVKCRAAASWINDVMVSSGAEMFELEPAQEPDIPPELRASIIDHIRLEAQQLVMQGGVVTPDMVQDRMEELHDRVLRDIRQEAEEAANRMENKMRDQLDASDWATEFRSFIDDFVTYPTAIFKGPSVRRKKRIEWGPGFKAITVNDLVRNFGRVSPYDIYPGPGAMGPQHNFLIERHRINSTALHEMKGTPGYDDAAIDECLQRYPHGYRDWLMGDTVRDQLAGKFNTWRSEEIDVLEFWGPVMGSTLKEWGMKGQLDPNCPYEINAWWVGPYVLRAILNPDPLGLRPYETASWEPIPGAFWGTALPEIMRDVQALCNAAARALANNMGIASGPQAEVTVDRLPVGEQITSMYPWKLWQVTSDKTGGGQPAIRFFQPNSNAAELMSVYQTFAKQADEVTGIPNYVYGSSQVGGAGRTASGLSMLMDNASKGIKSAIVNIDVVVNGMMERLYIHNMLYDPDTYVKGDFRVKARGAAYLLAREQTAQRRRDFLSATANPIDVQIMGPAGRAYLLKDVATSLQMDADRLVPNVPDSFNPWAQQTNAASQPAPQPGAPGPQLPPPGAEAPQPMPTPSQ